MAGSLKYAWSEAKGAFAVTLDGEVITYTATEEAAEEYIGRFTGASRAKKTPADRKEA